MRKKRCIWVWGSERKSKGKSFLALSGLRWVLTKFTSEFSSVDNIWGNVLFWRWCRYNVKKYTFNLRLIGTWVRNINEKVTEVAPRKKHDILMKMRKEALIYYSNIFRCLFKLKTTTTLNDKPQINYAVHFGSMCLLLFVLCLLYSKRKCVIFLFYASSSFYIYYAYPLIFGDRKGAVCIKHDVLVE